MNRCTYRCINFSFFDARAIEAYLAKMAQKGLLLENAGTVFWRFRRASPQKLRFCCIYSPSRTEFDSGLSEEEQSRAEFCEHDGWKLCAKWQQMLIFQNEDPDAVPIETDAVMQLSVIERTMKKSFFPQQFLLIFLSLLQTVTQLTSLFSDPIRFYTNAISVVLVPFWAFFLLFVLISLLRSFLWLRRANQTAQHGTLPELRTAHLPSLPAVSVLLLLLFSPLLFAAQWRSVVLISLLCVLIIALATGFKNRLRRKNTPAHINRSLTMLLVFFLTMLMIAGVCIVTFSRQERGKPVTSYQQHGVSFDVYDDELPLTLEMLYDVPDSIAWSKEKHTRRSVLAQNIDCRQWPLTDDPDAPELAYRLYSARFPFILDAFEQALLEESGGSVVLDGKTVYPKYEEIPAAPWGAVRAYRRSDFDSRDHLLLRYEKTILSIALPEPADDTLAARLAAALEVLPERLSF